MITRTSRMLRAARTFAACTLMLCVLVGGQCSPDDGMDGNVNTNGDGNLNENANVNENQNGSDNVNQNDNGSVSGPGANEVFVEFNSDLSDSEVARALSGNSTEYSFLGAKNSSGEAQSIDQVELVLATDVAVRATLQASRGGRPTSLLGGDDTALLFEYDEEAFTFEVVLIGSDGETLRDQFSLPETSSAFQVGVVYCNDLLAGLIDVLDAAFAACTDESSSTFCSGSMALAAEQLQNFCTFSQTIVDGLLPSGIGRAPSLGVPLGVTVQAASSTVAPDEGVTLRGAALGGTAPYQFVWAVVDGPTVGQEVSANDSGSLSIASVNLPAEGLYTVRLTVIDNAARIAFFDLQVSVASEPGMLDISVTVTEPEVVSAAPFEASATLTATPAGGAPPYDYEWTLVDGPASVTLTDAQAPETTALFDAAGTYILEVNVTDELGTTDTASRALVIVDPATSLVAEISVQSADACSGDQVGDACINLGEAVTFGVNLQNQEADSTELEYVWTTTTPSGESPRISNEADLTIDTDLPEDAIPGTWVVTLSVTDPVKDQTDSDQVVLQVQQVGDLSAIILHDGFGEVGVPEIVIAQVSGFVGDLTYQWSLSGGSEATGSFEPDNVQAVQLTPDSVGYVALEVQVTDDELGQTITVSTVDPGMVGESEIAHMCVVPFTIAGFTGPCEFVPAEDGDPCELDEPSDTDNVGSCTVSSQTLTEIGVVLSSDAPDDVTYEWTVELVDPDDSLTVIVIPGTDETSELQLLADGDGTFVLALTVTDPDNPANNLASATLQVVSACLPGDVPIADALIQDGSLEGAAAVIADEGAAVVLDCVSNNEDDTNRTYAWTQTDDSGISVTVRAVDCAGAFDNSVGDACVTMPAAPAELLAGGLAFQCAVSNDLALCDNVSEELVVYFDPILADLDDPTVVGGAQVMIQCTQASGSTADLVWSQVSGDSVSFSDNGAGLLSFTAPSGPASLDFECTPSITAADDSVLFGTAESVTVTINP